MQEYDIKKKLLEKMEQLSVHMEKMNIAEYVALMQDPKRLLYLNFLAGLARGVGIAIGVTLLGALVLYILQRLVLLNLPLIGDFIADLIDIVQNQQGQ